MQHQQPIRAPGKYANLLLAIENAMAGRLTGQTSREAGAQSKGIPRVSLVAETKITVQVVVG